MKYFNILILFMAFVWATPGNAQSKKITFVEHFSNTKCPICQRERPGIYQDLQKYKGEINTMTLHLKRPYSSCPLYKYNETAADNRESIYAGSTDPITSTPRLGVNCNITSARLLVNKIDQAKEDNEVPVGLNMVEKGTSSKEVSLEVTNLTDADMDHLYVYAALVQKVVNINVDNQDWEIHDVFRKFLGEQKGLGDAVGVVKSGETKKIVLKGDVPSELDAGDLYVLAWVEQRVPDGDNYRLIMHNSVSINTSTITSTELKVPASELSIYPNPGRDLLHLRNTSDFTPHQYRILSGAGREIKRMDAMGTIDISDLTPGNYFLVMENDHARVSRKFIKQ